MKFNVETKNEWNTNSDKIIFPTKSKKSWRDYVKDIRLEISCGEAPYVVSRYDVVTGKKINLHDRIGFLDRKIRVVSENVESYEDWIFWIEQALKSTYAYELQGDNLILARINVLKTIIENYQERFDKKIDEELMKKYAEIISWNVWQMDGIAYTIPGTSKECYIMDWTNNEKVKFTSILSDKG